MKNRKPSIEINTLHGDILVLELDISRPAGNGKHYVFKCRCKCGKELSMTTQDIKHNRACWHKRYRDLIGFQIHNILVIDEDEPDLRYNRKRRKWKYKCLLCNKIKSETGDVILRGDITSCGNHRPSGPNHFRYNPNQDRYRRDSRECKKWSKNIMSQFNYKCIVCGDTRRLNAHHLDGFNWAIEKRFDLENGVCMCKKCHCDFHSVYGVGSNTKEQFIEYINTRISIINNIILNNMYIGIIT